MEKNWVSIFSTNQTYLIQLAKAVLEEENIETVEINKQDSSYTILGGIELFVNIQDVVKARHLIQELIP